jgi:hypothetical protein
LGKPSSGGSVHATDHNILKHIGPRVGATQVLSAFPLALTISMTESSGLPLTCASMSTVTVDAAVVVMR